MSLGRQKFIPHRNGTMTVWAAVELLKGHIITTEDCIDSHHGWRLGAIIHALRERGWEIDTDMRPARDGSRRIAHYSLVHAPEVEKARYRKPKAA